MLLKGIETEVLRQYFDEGLCEVSEGTLRVDSENSTLSLQYFVETQGGLVVQDHERHYCLTCGHYVATEFVWFLHLPKKGQEALQNYDGGNLFADCMFCNPPCEDCGGDDASPTLTLNGGMLCGPCLKDRAQNSLWWETKEFYEIESPQLGRLFIIPLRYYLSKGVDIEDLTVLWDDLDCSRFNDLDNPRILSWIGNPDSDGYLSNWWIDTCRRFQEEGHSEPEFIPPVILIGEKFSCIGWIVPLVNGNIPRHKIHPIYGGIFLTDSAAIVTTVAC